MSALLTPRSRPSNDGEPSGAAIHLVLASAETGVPCPDRRHAARIPYPYPIQLTPVAADGTKSDEQKMVVLGKHLSEQGLDFYHRDPLPFRRVIASWKVAEQWVELPLDLRWCRFGEHGWYESGGRFLLETSGKLPGLRPAALPNQPNHLTDSLASTIEARAFASSDGKPPN